MALAGVCPVPWGLSCPLGTCWHLVLGTWCGWSHSTAWLPVGAKHRDNQNSRSVKMMLPCATSPHLGVLGPAGRWGQALTLQGRVPAPLCAVQPGQRRCCRQLWNGHPARTSISHVLNCLQNGNLNLLLVLPNSLSPPIFPCLSDTLRSNRNRDFSGNVIYFP